MCFISHQNRLLDDSVSTASEILENASKLALKLEPNISRFCLAYLSYSKGRFVQQMVKNILPGKNWIKKFTWEEKPSEEFFSTSLQKLSEWPSEVIRRDSTLKRTIERIAKIEQIELLTSKFRDDLDRAKQLEDEISTQNTIQRAEESASELNELLGSHGETAYAYKKLADNLVFNSENKEKAAFFYEKAYNMNKTMKGSSIANVLILKNWSRCFTDKEKTREKLEEAEKLLDDNHMTRHQWYQRVQLEKEKLSRP